MSNFNTPLRSGNYVGEIISQKLTKSKNDNPVFEAVFGNLGFETSDGYEQVDTGVTRTVFMHLTTKSQSYTIRKLAECGFEGKPSQWNLGSDESIDCTGNLVKLHMKPSEYGENWDVSLGSGSQQMSVSDALQADAQWSHVMAKGSPTAASEDTIGTERPTGTFASME
jgi:hypothetical protein